MALTGTPALYVDDTGVFKVRRDLPTPDPAQDEVLVKIFFSGINPADIKHKNLGVLSTILGYDFSGEVVEAPPGSAFERGDVVAGLTPTGVGRPVRYGAHQSHLACPLDMLFKVPAYLAQQDAAALSVVALTAADVVFNLFGLSLPDEEHGVSAASATVLIWGASTSVGLCAVQYARAAGVRHIFITASPARHELLQSLGATACFDYSDPGAISQIATAVKQASDKGLTYALDAVGDPFAAEKLVACSTDETVLVSTTVLRPDFQMPLATKNSNTKLRPTGMPTDLTIPAQPAAWEKMRRALLWAVSHYGAEFKLPKVEVFAGNAEEALQRVKDVTERGKFGKVVLKHPFET